MLVIPGKKRKKLKEDKLSVGEEEQRNEVYEIYSIEETATKPSGSCSSV